MKFCATNRTTLELKRTSTSGTATSSETTNRTTLELKQ